MFPILLVVLGAVLLVAGFVGCVLPAIPGPPVAFLALLCVELARDGSVYGAGFLVAMGAMAAAVTLLDVVVPAIGARRYGASRGGTWGAVVGTVVGIFFVPPWGMLLGAWAGALGGELLVGKPPGAAWRAAWGVFVGTLAGLFLKLAACGLIAYFFVSGLLG